METSSKRPGRRAAASRRPRIRRGSSGFFSDVIVELGFVDQETADWAVEQGRVVGQAVPEVLLEAQILTEDQLSRATAELHGLEHVDLDEFGVDLDVARLISRIGCARATRPVPFAFDDDGTLLVALSDPVDPLAVDDIAVMTKSDVHPMVATKSSIDAVIEQLANAPAHRPLPRQPRMESVYGRVPGSPRRRDAARACLSEPLPAPPPPAPDPAAGEEMAQMRQALADLAARVESFTASPAEPPGPGAGVRGPAEPTVTLEDHDHVLERLAEAERRAGEADGALDRLADAERRARRPTRARRLRTPSAAQAEAALAELRTQREQERGRHRQAEQAMRAQIESAKEAARSLEQRLRERPRRDGRDRAACEGLVEPAPR